MGPGSAAELKPRELTVAESPMLSTKRRSALRSSSVAEVRQKGFACLYPCNCFAECVFLVLQPATIAELVSCH